MLPEHRSLVGSGYMQFGIVSMKQVELALKRSCRNLNRKVAGIAWIGADGHATLCMAR